jgi:hypothetical protein
MSELLVKLGKSGSQIRKMLVQVYGDNAMKKTAVYKWVTRFSEGREKVPQILRENRRLTVRSIAQQATIDREPGKS